MREGAHARRSIAGATLSSPAWGAPGDELFFPHGGANFPSLVQVNRPFPERPGSLKSSIEMNRAALRLGWGSGQASRPKPSPLGRLARAQASALGSRPDA